jgi:phosphomevalonate kinase
LEKQGKSWTLKTLQTLEPFFIFGKPLNELSKTGLGSSAALVTSLMGLLMHYFQLIQPDTSEALEKIYHASQFVHCLYQNKIGSGFDISCGVYGSQSYVRFTPEHLKPLLDQGLNSETILNIDNPEYNFSDTLMNRLWDSMIEPFQMSPALHVRLMDVNAGCSTPALVSALLKWKMEHVELGM